MSFGSKLLLGVTVLALAASPLLAEEAKQNKKNKGPQLPGPVRAELNLLKDMELTELQKQQVKDLETKYVSRFIELQDKMNNVQTAEQRAARVEAQKKAKTEGKKGPDVKAAIEAAAPMTDAQRSTQKELNKEMKMAHQEMHESLLALLTDAQKEHLPKPPEKKKKNK